MPFAFCLLPSAFCLFKWRRNPVKTLSFITRILPLLALFATSTLSAQTPDATPAETPPPKPKYAVLENELALYSPLDSPWADLKANHAFEAHLFNLLRAEVRLWTLQDELAAQSGPASEQAAEISRIVHGQILDEATEALPLLQRTPNRPLATLLVHQLEAYPFEWKEEGSEDVLPNLHKLIDPPAGKPATESGARRRRPRHTPAPDN